MADPKKRIIVDGVDFEQLVQFPKIISAVSSALQPARLMLALFMVVALVAFGEAWDSLTTPSVHPAGLVAGRWSETDTPAQQRVLRDALNAFALTDQPFSSGTDQSLDELEIRDVLAQITRNYRQQREAAADSETRRQLDEEYARAVRSIAAVQPRGAFDATASHVASAVRRMIMGVLSLSGTEVLAGAAELFVGTPRLLWAHQPWFLVLYSLFFLVVYSFIGGAISRMAACQFAGHERLRFREAADFAIGNWPRLIWAQALPLVIALCLSAFVVILGLLMGLPALDVLGGLLYGVALLVGFLIAFLLLGYAVGGWLLVPAVASENCEGADAMQRAYAYTVMRPLHLLGYWVVALIGLALGFVLVSVVAALMMNVTAALYGVLTDNPAMGIAGGFGWTDLSPQSVDSAAMAWHHVAAASLIDFWQTLVVSLVAAYVISYHLSASTIIYLLMRRTVDGQDVSEIWRPGLVPGTLTPMPEPVVKPAASSAAANEGATDGAAL